MKVVHFESGLGNQMLDYVDYLMIKKSNPDDVVYMEDIIYDIIDSHKVISMWNGYELQRIFNINLPNISSIDGLDYERVKREMSQSKFWEKGWDYSTPFVNSLNNQGIYLKNCIVKKQAYHPESEKTFSSRVKRKVKESRIGAMALNVKNRCALSEETKNITLYNSTVEDEYCGHSLMGMFKGYGIEDVEDSVRHAFLFPAIDDEKNKEFLALTMKYNVVSVHARRGDYLSINGYCYRNGYFKRAVKYVKSKDDNLFFAFFSDPQSVGWIKNNLSIFGLKEENDRIIYVDWNSGRESFRDMQLMSMCKHNVITQSSFGWWGSYLNSNSNKITIAPNPQIIATNFV